MCRELKKDISEVLNMPSEHFDFWIDIFSIEAEENKREKAKADAERKSKGGGGKASLIRR